MVAGVRDERRNGLVLFLWIQGADPSTQISHRRHVHTQDTFVSRHLIPSVQVEVRPHGQTQNRHDDWVIWCGVWAWQPPDTPPCEGQLGGPVGEGATHRHIGTPVLPAEYKGDLVLVHSLWIGLGWLTLLPSPFIKLGQVRAHCNQSERSPANQIGYNKLASVSVTVPSTGDP